MPNLLKIGATVINLDLVTDMVITAKEIIVYLSAPAGRRGQIQGRMLRFAGAEAEHLRAWLTMHMTELAPAPEQEPRAAEAVVQHASLTQSAGLSNLLRAASGTGRALQRSLFNRRVS
jgi:hypothetical protein